MQGGCTDPWELDEDSSKPVRITIDLLPLLPRPLCASTGEMFVHGG